MAPGASSRALGRQVNFFMSRDDEKNFLEHVKHTAKVEIFPNSLATEWLLPIPVLLDRVTQSLDDRRFFLYNRDVSLRLFFVASKDKSHYSVDWTRASVVEFERCIIEEGIMYSGRIWADFLAYDAEAKTMQEKEAEFRKWYESLASWIQKSYRPIRLYDPGMSKVPSWILYAGPGAENFHRGGGQLSPNPPGAKTLLLVDLKGRETWVERGPATT